MMLRKKKRARRPARRPAAPTPARKGAKAGEQAAPAPDKPKAGRTRLSSRAGVVPLALSLALILLLYAAALIYLRPESPGRAMTLDAVVNAANNKTVRSATFLDEDARVLGTLAEEGRTVRFWTAYPRSDIATNDLLTNFLANDTQVTIDPQSGKALVRFVAQFLLPLVILANLFALLFFLSRRGDASGDELVAFSRIGDRRLGTKEKSSTTFASVAAATEAVAELADVRDYLADPKAFRKMGALPPKGVLLVGPPGCGKTLLARAVAGEARASFYSISGSEFVESLVGVGAARVRDLFRQARADAPALLFIDELDAVGRQRGTGLGGGHDEREQTLNELLVQMDGFSPTEGVAVLAATNRPDILDPALLRPGRFDRHITVERPDVDGRLDILRLHSRDKRLANPEPDLSIVARRTAGFTGADLAALLNEAALLAVRERAGAVSLAHLDEGVERVLSGPRRRAVVMSPDEKRRLAYHEAGHAVVAAAFGQARVVDKLSIIARGRGVGHLAVLARDSLFPTRSDMEARVAVAMAGIAAEDLVLGEPSVGSEQDLERATNTARDMAGRYGMSDRLGRARVLGEEREIFLGRDYLSARDVSQPTLEHLDNEVNHILEEQESAARSILSDQRHVLDTLAESLLAHETVQGADLDAALADVVAYIRPPTSSRPRSSSTRRASART